MVSPIVNIYKHRQILYNMVILNLKKKYIASTLGMVWLILYPILFLGLYAVVYIFIFKVRLGMMSPYDYVLVIFIGLVPFLSFTDSLGVGVSSITENSNLVKNTLFPIEITPVSIVLSSQTIQIIGFFILSLIYFYKGTLGVNFIFLFVMWFFQLVFSVGLLWLISSLNVFFRDIGNIIPLIILMLMMISPIAYTEEMVPEGLKGFLYMNPLYYMIIFYQKIFLLNTVDYKLLSIFGIVSIITFFIGFKVFMKTKGLFSEYI